MLQWPHGGHGDRARRLWRASVGPRPAGTRFGGAICCVAAPPGGAVASSSFRGPRGGAPDKNGGDVQEVFFCTEPISRFIDLFPVHLVRGTGHGAALPAQPANRTSTYHPYNHSNTASRLTLICTGSREDSSAIRWLAAPPPRTITARVRHAYATICRSRSHDVYCCCCCCCCCARSARDLHAQKVKLPPSFECV